MLHKFFQVGKIFQNSGRRISEKNDERKKNETMDNAVRHMRLGERRVRQHRRAAQPGVGETVEWTNKQQQRGM